MLSDTKESNKVAQRELFQGLLKKNLDIIKE